MPQIKNHEGIIRSNDPVIQQRNYSSETAAKLQLSGAHPIKNNIKDLSSILRTAGGGLSRFRQPKH